MGAVVAGEVRTDSQPTQQLAELYEAEVEAEERARHFPLGLNDSFALNQYDWLEAIRQRRQAEMSGREGLRDLAAAFAVLESSLAGCTVAVDEVVHGQRREYQRPIDERFGLR